MIVNCTLLQPESLLDWCKSLLIVIYLFCGVNDIVIVCLFQFNKDFVYNKRRPSLTLYWDVWTIESNSDFRELIFTFIKQLLHHGREEWSPCTLDWERFSLSSQKRGFGYTAFGYYLN